MSRKAYVRPKNWLGEILRFLHSLISLGRKLKEHPSEKLDNFILVAHMLRDSVTRPQPAHKEGVGGFVFVSNTQNQNPPNLLPYD